MTQITVPIQPEQDTKRETAEMQHTRARSFSVTWVTIALAIIVIMAAGLRLVNASAIGDGNTYYTAAVENMLQSPSNFFYGVADAGGVTVDKPPLGLWIQAIFGAVLGVNGFTVTLPSIIAGTLSVLVLYHLVKKGFGSTAGLIAALVLAITPVSIAVDRTNNVDSILIFVLLLATWAFVRAVETGKWRHVLIGAALVGVGFNVKMLQAYLILPALYAFYLFAASVPWRRKVMQLVAATVVLLAVSLSWVAVVDLTPADSRPYVGSSESNSALELVVGYNGLTRLLGGMGVPGGNPPANVDAPNSAANGDAPTGFMMGGPGGTSEIGAAGATRLFEEALANELAWLLPFGLLSIGVLVFRRRITFPLAREHGAVMLWGGWLLTGVVFFSVASFFHAYYLATLAPALAALVGIGAVTVWNGSGWLWRGIGAVMIALTVAVQFGIITLYGVDAMPFVVAVGAALLTAGVVALVALPIGKGVRPSMIVAVGGIAVLFAIPTLWSGATAFDTNANAQLPAAYAGASTSGFGGGMSRAAGMMGDMFAPITEYALANTSDAKYDLVVPSSMMGSQITLNTDLTVLYSGGFSGQDDVYSADEFAQMVSAGEIGVVMGISEETELGAYVASACRLVEGVSIQAPNIAAIGELFGGTPPMAPPTAGGGNDTGSGMPGFPPGGMPGGPGMPFGSSTLYDCSIE
jgi:4-amino-4-deoxy-L-arabinose transferase-like glycosyltransferase